MIDYVIAFLLAVLVLYLYSWALILKVTDYSAKVISHTLVFKWTHLGILIILTPVTYWAIQLWR